ncbi:hypothetical protein I0C86_41700 [Plantactinospora sp. S1510]|uniref:Uncharacterized protein n=1 Tax=Plantactinospora alkalitolerans TaxID=2789879 RepID=A0ABS0HB32_9ACTN|nr:hypothetical protein [Plantactinospora alkalitolerans]MBF9135369.1 hypothetical protein [Plantactinospora alkalitolerans]
MPELPVGAPLPTVVAIYLLVGIGLTEAIRQTYWLAREALWQLALWRARRWSRREWAKLLPPELPKRRLPRRRPPINHDGGKEA